MRIVLIGGTGATGAEVLRQACESPFVSQVLSLQRGRPHFFHDKLSIREMDLSNPNAFTDLDLSSYDVAVNTLGTTLKESGSQQAQWKVDHDIPLEFAKKCRKDGIGHFINLSAQFADSDSLNFYSRMKGKLEDDLVSLGFPTLSILRPGMLDRPDTDRVGEKLGVKLFNLLSKAKPDATWRPMPTPELAKAIMKIAQRPEKGYKRYGPERLWNEIESK